MAVFVFLLLIIFLIFSVVLLFVGVNNWDELHPMLYSIYEAIHEDFKKRFDLGSLLLNMASVVDPRHRALSYLDVSTRGDVFDNLKQEMLNLLASVADVPSHSEEPPIKRFKHSSEPERKGPTFVESFFSFDEVLSLC